MRNLKPKHAQKIVDRAINSAGWSAVFILIYLYVAAIVSLSQQRLLIVRPTQFAALVTAGVIASLLEEK